MCGRQLMRCTYLLSGVREFANNVQRPSQDINSKHATIIATLYAVLCEIYGYKIK